MDYKKILLRYQEKLQQEFHLTPIIGCELEFYTTCCPKEITFKTKRELFPENGTNQFEIKLPHTQNVFKLTEEIELFKNELKKISKQFKAKTSFAAKPFDHQPGSALHIHLNFLHKDVYEKGSNPLYLTYAIGGLLHTFTAFMIFFTKDENSYKRYTKSMTSPTNISWGYNNRTAAIRLLKNLDGIRRAEHRVAGADSDPLQVVMAILAGAYTGIKEKIIPPPQTYGLAFDSQYDLVPLIKDMKIAKKAFEKSKFYDMFSSLETII